jgi:hypothetical protein
MSTLRDGTNVSDIATYRTNFTSKNGTKQTFKNQQILKDLRGSREYQIDEDDDEDEDNSTAFE